MSAILVNIYERVIFMPACTFFGHRDTPRDIEPDLRAAIVDLIEMFVLGSL